MVIVDANVLVDAVNGQLIHHAAARRWLEDALAGRETVGLPWLSLVAFLRLTTNRRIFPTPLSVAESARIIESWLDVEVAVPLEPGPGHIGSVARLLTAAGTAGDLVNDAHLAAMALEHDAEVITYDRDFGRFAGVRWRIP